MSCMGVDWKQTACRLITWSSNHSSGISGLSLAQPVYIYSLCSSGCHLFYDVYEPSVEGSSLALSLTTASPWKSFLQVSFPASHRLLWAPTSLTLYKPHFYVVCLLWVSFFNNKLRIISHAYFTLNGLYRGRSGSA